MGVTLPDTNTLTSLSRKSQTTGKQGLTRARGRVLYKEEYRETTDQTRQELDQHEQDMVTTDNGVEHQKHEDKPMDKGVECTLIQAANPQEIETNNTAVSHGKEMEISRDDADDVGEYALEQTQVDTLSIQTDSERDIKKSGKKRDNPTNTDIDGRKAKEDEHDPTEATQTTLRQHSAKRNKKIKMERETTAQRERERTRSKSRLKPPPRD
jgi:hypothetical protein